MTETKENGAGAEKAAVAPVGDEPETVPAAEAEAAAEGAVAGVETASGEEPVGVEAAVAEAAVSLDDPEAMEREIEAFGSVDLEAQSKRIAHGRPVEEYLDDPEVQETVRREMAENGMLDPIASGTRVREDVVPEEESFTLVKWRRKWMRLPVTPAEALEGARNRREGLEGAAVETGVEEDAVEADRDAPVDEEEPEPRQSSGGEDGGEKDATGQASPSGGGADVAGGDGEETKPSAERPEDRSASVAEAEAGAAREPAVSAEELKEAVAEASRGEMRKGLKKLGESNRTIQESIVEVLQDGMGQLEEKVATVEAGQVGRLVETISDFGKKVDDYVADFHRSKEIQARRRGWGRWALAGAVAPVLVVAGLMGQKQFDVIPDGTNGWKSIVWESHGLAVAKCMRRAQNSGNPVNCPLRVRPR